MKAIRKRVHIVTKAAGYFGFAYMLCGSTAFAQECCVNIDIDPCAIFPEMCGALPPPPVPPPPPPAPASLGSVLLPGQTMYANQYLSSPDGNYQLWMQADGNLVLYDMRVGITYSGAVWHSHTYGLPGLRAVMQSDGNFVLYDGANNVYWATNTFAVKSPFLALQNRGLLVVYGQQGIWSTQTPVGACAGVPPAVYPNRIGKIPSSRLLVTEVLSSKYYDPSYIVTSNADRIISPNKCYELVMQTDSNLVIYRRTDGAVIKQSQSVTQGNAPIAILQPDGNFVVYSEPQVNIHWARWQSQTTGVPAFEVIMQDDGDAVLYSPVLPVWVNGEGIWNGANNDEPWYAHLFALLPGNSFTTCFGAPPPDQGDSATMNWIQGFFKCSWPH